MKPESRLQRKIRADLEESVGGYWRKIHGGPFQVGGLPDILGCVQGLFFGFEVKRPGEALSELQFYEINEIQRQGGTAARVESSEQAIALVRAALSRAERSVPLHLQPRSYKRRRRLVR